MVGVVETDSQRAVWHRLKSIALAREADTAETHSLPRAVDAAVGEDLPRLPQAVIGIAIIEEPRRHTECRRKGIFSVRSEVAQAVIAARQQHLPRAVALIGGLCAARVGAVGFDRSAFKGLARCAVYQNYACLLARHGQAQGTHARDAHHLARKATPVCQEFAKVKPGRVQAERQTISLLGIWRHSAERLGHRRDCLACNFSQLIYCPLTRLVIVGGQFQWQKAQSSLLQVSRLDGNGVGATRQAESGQIGNFSLWLFLRFEEIAQPSRAVGLAIARQRRARRSIGKAVGLGNIGSLIGTAKGDGSINCLRHIGIFLNHAAQNLYIIIIVCRYGIQTIEAQQEDGGAVAVGKVARDGLPVSSGTFLARQEVGGAYAAQHDAQHVIAKQPAVFSFRKERQIVLGTGAAQGFHRLQRLAHMPPGGGNGGGVASACRDPHVSRTEQCVAQGAIGNAVGRIGHRLKLFDEHPRRVGRKGPPLLHQHEHRLHLLHAVAFRLRLIINVAHGSQDSFRQIFLLRCLHVFPKRFVRLRRYGHNRNRAKPCGKRQLFA